MENQLTAVIDDGLGKVETLTGTREEIERSIENCLDPALISIIVTDDQGLVVGRKLFGISEIAWGREQACPPSSEHPIQERFS